MIVAEPEVKRYQKQVIHNQDCPKCKDKGVVINREGRVIPCREC
jgi:hypothetical protein